MRKRERRKSKGSKLRRKMVERTEGNKKESEIGIDIIKGEKEGDRNSAIESVSFIFVIIFSIIIYYRYLLSLSSL